jgi:hypothetical protein
MENLHGKRILKMIDRIVGILFKWAGLRKALFSEVHMYDRLNHIMADPEAMEIGSSFIPDFDGWRSWSLNKDKGRYYFNDIPEDNMMAAIERLEDMELSTS